MPHDVTPAQLETLLNGLLQVLSFGLVDPTGSSSLQLPARSLRALVNLLTWHDWQAGRPPQCCLRAAQSRPYTPQTIIWQAEEKLPYSFFIEEQELAAELGAHLLKHKASRLLRQQGQG